MWIVLLFIFHRQIFLRGCLDTRHKPWFVTCMWWVNISLEAKRHKSGVPPQPSNWRHIPDYNEKEDCTEVRIPESLIRLTETLTKKLSPKRLDDLIQAVYIFNLWLDLESRHQCDLFDWIEHVLRAKDIKDLGHVHCIIDQLILSMGFCLIIGIELIFA